MEAAVSRLPFWQLLTEQERDTVQRSAMVRRYEKGALIHDGGSECLGLLLVLSGEIRTYLLSDEGREVPAHGDIMEMHDVIDNIEKELAEKLHCQAVIHMDPIVTDDASVGVLRRQIAEVVKQVDPRMTIHDFRMVQGTTHTNLIFDAVLPFSSGKTPEQAAEEIRRRVRQLNDTYFAVVTVEHSYTD